VTPTAATGALVVAALLLLAWRPFPASGPPGGSSTAGRTVAEGPSVVGVGAGGKGRDGSNGDGDD
jgi:hypothetical protein